MFPTLTSMERLEVRWRMKVGTVTKILGSDGKFHYWDRGPVKYNRKGRGKVQLHPQIVKFRFRSANIHIFEKKCRVM